MSASNQSSSSASTDPGDQIHPSLLGIATAMEQYERETKQRMSAAQSFLQNIDAWAKSQAGTEIATIVAPLLENISHFVTEFAIGKHNTTSTQCKNSYPIVPQITTSVPRVTKIIEKPRPVLPQKPQVNASPWVTVARKVAKLPDPPANPAKRMPQAQLKRAEQEPAKEDK